MPGYLSEKTRICDAFQVHSHNTYKKSVSKNFLDILEADVTADYNRARKYHMRAIEIDIWDLSSYPLGQGRKKNWYVRHEPLSENENNFGDGDFGTCLTLLFDWHCRHPNHELLTVFIDKKEAWGDTKNGRSPENLDELILQKIGTRNIYKPSDLLGKYGSLRQAAQAKNWPTLEEARNKFLFILTGGELFNHNKTQAEYIKRRKDKAILFVCPDADEPSDITDTPNQFDSQTASWIVCHNLNRPKLVESLDEYAPITQIIRHNNYLAHIWGRDDGNNSYMEAVAHKINYLGQDQYKQPYRLGYNAHLPEGDYTVSDLPGVNLIKVGEVSSEGNPKPNQLQRASENFKVHAIPENTLALMWTVISNSKIDSHQIVFDVWCDVPVSLHELKGKDKRIFQKLISGQTTEVPSKLEKLYIANPLHTKQQRFTVVCSAVVKDAGV